MRERAQAAWEGGWGVVWCGGVLLVLEHVVAVNGRWGTAILVVPERTLNSGQNILSAKCFSNSYFSYVNTFGLIYQIWQIFRVKLNVHRYLT